MDPEPQPEAVADAAGASCTDLSAVYTTDSVSATVGSSSSEWSLLFQVQNVQLSARGLAGIGAQLEGWFLSGQAPEDGPSRQHVGHVRARLLRRPPEGAGGWPEGVLVAVADSIFGGAPPTKAAARTELPRDFAEQVQPGDSIAFECRVTDSRGTGLDSLDLPAVSTLFIVGFTATFRPVLSPEEAAAAAAAAAKEAAAIAEAAAAAVALTKVGGGHIVVTNHPVPEFCVRYSLPSPPEGVGGAIAADARHRRAAAFVNLHGHILFWHTASHSWVLGFDHKQQDLTEEELFKCATLSLPELSRNDAPHGTHAWTHKGKTVDITLTSFEEEKVAADAVQARKHTTSSFDSRFGKAAMTESISEKAMASMSEHQALLQSEELEEQLVGAQFFRRILSFERNPPIDEVLAAMVLPILLERMSTAPTAIQFEALWAITNIASGTSDQTAQVVPALPIIARLIRSPNQEVSEQAVWAVGNIAGDSTALRDSVLEAGALVSLVGILDQLALKAKQKISLLRNAVWTISNCCRGKPQPALELVRPALPGLAKVIWEADAEVVADACWALSYLSDGPDERLQAVIDAGVLTQVVRLLEHEAANVVTPALRTVGNLVTGDDAQTQQVLDARPDAGKQRPSAPEAAERRLAFAHCLLGDGVPEDSPLMLLDALHDLASTIGQQVVGEIRTVPRLAGLLTHPKRALRKEAAWTLSNITAGTSDQIQLVIDANAIPKLVAAIGYSEASGEYGDDFDVVKEACWVLSNATSGGSQQQIRSLCEQGCVAAMSKLLTCPDDRIVQVALEGLLNILQSRLREDEDGSRGHYGECHALFKNAHARLRSLVANPNIGGEVGGQAKTVLELLAHLQAGTEDEEVPQHERPSGADAEDPIEDY